MFHLELIDDAGNRASDVRLAKRAVDSAVAANTLFASDAEGAKGLFGVRWALCNRRF